MARTCYHLQWDISLLVLLAFCNHSIAIKCYVGSKGFSQNGKAVHSFLPNQCEDEMTHCFESYTDDMSQITASCQSLNTEKRLLDVCKEGCRNHTDLHVTICCCDSDLCNLPPEEKRKAEESSENSEDIDVDPIEVVEKNVTVTNNSTELMDESPLAELLEHPKFLRLPHAL